MKITVKGDHPIDAPVAIIKGRILCKDSSVAKVTGTTGRDYPGPVVSRGWRPHGAVVILITKQYDF